MQSILHHSATAFTLLPQAHSLQQLHRGQPLPRVLLPTTNLTSQRSSHGMQQSCLRQPARTSSVCQASQQQLAAACSPARVPACQHSWGNSRPFRSSRCANMQVHVFDKIKDMLSGGASGWAGPPEGQPGAAAASSSAADDDGAAMVRIDAESTGGLGGTTEEVLGPLAVLLVGFMPQELDAFRAMMNDMDADIVKLIPATKAMLGNTLSEAFETEFPQYEQPPLGQRRALFFSGMYGSEVTEVIAAYRDAGLPPCVFAGLVPNNADRTVAELLDAVWRDHAAMMAKLQKQQKQSGGVDDSY